MISVDDHLASILSTVRPLAPLELDLLDADGTVLAEDVTAPIALPPFDNSAMDGYAVRAADVAEVPAVLKVVEDIAAGDGTLRAVGSGHAARIMTGAPMPAGADAVVPVEWTDGGTVEVTIHRAPAAGNAIRRSGEDVRAGDVVLKAGAALGPPQLGIAAAVGRRGVRVHPRPRVVAMSTGAELAEPGQPVGDGMIWDSNSFMLASAARAAGCAGYRVAATADDPAAFLEELETQLVRADAIVTSGGVSMGAYEPVKQALAPLGTFAFIRVAMQPGMPQGFGTVDGVPVFALPGNPVSAFVSFILFVRPALRVMSGLPTVLQNTEPAVLTAPLRSPDGKRSFLRGLMSRADDGSLVVTPVRAQGSHQLAALASANCLVIVPEEITSVDAGAVVEVLPI